MKPPKDSNERAQGMRKGVYVLPNALTMTGMFFGFFSILSSFRGNFEAAAWGILIASVFDGLDGWVARLTNSASRFGVQLDSLSDLVAFGVAPAVLLYTWALVPFGRIGWAAAFLFMGCGALRLARFNVQAGTTESKAFTGMPIPGAAGIVAATVLFYLEMWETSPGKNWYLVLLTVVLAALMVSTLRYHGAKEVKLGKRKPFWMLVLFAVIVALVIAHPPIVLFSFGMIYMTAGIIENIYLFMRKRSTGRQQAS